MFESGFSGFSGFSGLKLKTFGSGMSLIEFIPI
jgi:hypothetical protein